ncbi:hypothetical protein TNCV_2518871 [Trichonephila clavipes]|nr:hypothetical protein TNCV_2518871 [Trichonephila clavipes]
MKSKHHRFVCCSEGSLSLVETKEKENRFEQTSRTLQRGEISMRSTKDQLVKKDVLMPVKQCFPVEPSGCRRGAFT